MSPRTPKYLEDIKDACEFILEVTHNISLIEFEQDRIRRQAVERNFEIIGEALRRISNEDINTFHMIPDCRRIISFRNILAHAYDGIDTKIVWQIIREDTSILLEHVIHLLKDYK